ncbi:hypothetical protein BG58_32025 [Caballeronia jiangsuensis]|nr:hypothetical protein BG58_32025 [Caballeronia jiangsuensis]
MARLIDLACRDTVSGALYLAVGDVLSCAAIGGRVIGPDALELLGPFIGGIVTGSGDILSPAGLPNRVLFVARKAGRTSLELYAGDMSRPPHVLTIDVEITE